MGSSTDLTADDLRWLSPLPLWTGILTGPIVFGITLMSNYALVHWACRTDRQVVLSGISLVALLAIIGSGWIAWVSLRHSPASAETDAGTPDARAKFMALLGLASSAFFAFAVIANAYPPWILDACQ